MRIPCKCISPTNSGSYAKVQVKEYDVLLLMRKIGLTCEIAYDTTSTFAPDPKKPDDTKTDKALTFHID
jgi:hypothetical protein